MNKMAKAKEEVKEEKKTYKTPILYLHKSKAGRHLFAFNMEKEGGEGMVLGDDVESLLVNISDVSAVLNGEMKWAKVSVLAKGDGE